MMYLRYLLPRENTGTDVTNNARAMGKLKKAVESAERTLSGQQSTRIEIEGFEGGKDFSESLTRANFEEIYFGGRWGPLNGC